MCRLAHAQTDCEAWARARSYLMMQAVQDYRLEEEGAVLVLVWPAGGPEDVYRTQ